jgi:hypothetical protein
LWLLDREQDIRPRVGNRDVDGVDLLGEGCHQQLSVVNVEVLQNW